MNTEFGISKKIHALMIGVFKSFPNIEKVIVFGSRAKGNFKNGSDIDLAFFAPHFSHDDYLKVLIKIEDLNLIYKIDLIDYYKIDHLPLKAHIDRVGKIFYEKK